MDRNQNNQQNQRPHNAGAVDRRAARRIARLNIPGRQPPAPPALPGNRGTNSRPRNREQAQQGYYGVAQYYQPYQAYYQAPMYPYAAGVYVLHGPQEAAPAANEPVQLQIQEYQQVQGSPAPRLEGVHPAEAEEDDYVFDAELGMLVQAEPQNIPALPQQAPAPAPVAAQQEEPVRHGFHPFRAPMPNDIALEQDRARARIAELEANNAQQTRDLQQCRTEKAELEQHALQAAQVNDDNLRQINYLNLQLSINRSVGSKLSSERDAAEANLKQWIDQCGHVKAQLAEKNEKIAELNQTVANQNSELERMKINQTTTDALYALKLQECKNLKTEKSTLETILNEKIQCGQNFMAEAMKRNADVDKFQQGVKRMKIEEGEQVIDEETDEAEKDKEKIRNAAKVNAGDADVNGARDQQVAQDAVIPPDVVSGQAAVANVENREVYLLHYLSLIMFDILLICQD